MKKKIAVVISGLLVLLVVACGMPGDPMLDDVYSRDIFPGVDSTYDVGSIALAFAEGHFDAVFIGGVPAGAGDVVGPAGATDEAIVRYDLATGKLIQDSTVTISDAGVITASIGRSATLTVAASNSGALSIAQADYNCSGAADDVEINVALNALPANGGRVVLLEGTYVLADPIIIPDDAITLEGQGASSFIDGDGLATTEHAIVISFKEDVWIRDLSIQTEGGGAKDSDCILIEDGSHDFVIDSVIFVDSDGSAIQVEGTSIWGGLITNCNIVSGDDYGIIIDMDGGNSSRYINITNNLIERVGSDGVVFGGTGSHDYNQIINNIFQNTGDDAIQVYDTNGIVINDNNMHAIGGYGMYLDNVNYSEVNNNSTFNTQFAAIYLNNCDNNNIVGNNLDSTLDADTEDGIYVDGHNNVISSNYMNDVERSGVYVTGKENVISNNEITDSHHHGINIQDTENLVIGNLITDAGQAAAGTYSGIFLTGSAHRCSIIGNTIIDDGTDTEDGVCLQNGAVEVKVSDNYIYNLMGSGISLIANNNDCQITDNYVQECDDYGIEIAAATCNDTHIIGNTLRDNVTAEYLDNGTDTGTFFEQISLIGDGKAWIEFRPDLDPTKLAVNAKPSAVGRGIALGYSLPVGGADEELFYNICVPDRWDGGSDVHMHIWAWLDTAQDNALDAVELTLNWQQVTEGEVVSAGSNPIIVEVVTGVVAQFTVIKFDFTLDYDVVPADPVLGDDTIFFHLVRTASSQEIDGEPVIFHAGVIFRCDKFGNATP